MTIAELATSVTIIEKRLQSYCCVRLRLLSNQDESGCWRGSCAFLGRAESALCCAGRGVGSAKRLNRNEPKASPTCLKELYGSSSAVSSAAVSVENRSNCEQHLQARKATHPVWIQEQDLAPRQCVKNSCKVAPAHVVEAVSSGHMF